jgi:flagellar biosynthesis protein FlhG
MNAQLDALRAFVAARPAPQHGRGGPNVLAIAGAKGGIGTSTVAALVAASCARQCGDTLLVDAAGAGSSLPHILGIGAMPEDDVIRIAPGLSLASASAAVGAGNAERSIRYRRMVADFRNYDAVIIDAGSTMDAVVLAAGSAARLLTIIAPDRVSLAAGYALLKVVSQRYGALPMGVLANRCTDAIGAASWQRVTAGTGRFLGHEVGYVGTIPEDAALAAAIEGGRALDVNPNGAAALAADDVVGRTLVEHDTRPNLSLIRM